MLTVHGRRSLALLNLRPLRSVLVAERKTKQRALSHGITLLFLIGPTASSIAAEYTLERRHELVIVHIRTSGRAGRTVRHWSC